MAGEGKELKTPLLGNKGERKDHGLPQQPPTNITSSQSYRPPSSRPTSSSAGTSKSIIPRYVAPGRRKSPAPLLPISAPPASTDDANVSQAGTWANESEETTKNASDRATRLEAMSTKFWEVSCNDFDKKIKEVHRKQLKDLMKERSELEEKARTLRKDADLILPSFYGYITASAVTIFGAVTSAEVLANDPGYARGLSLLPFIYAVSQFKDKALETLNNLKRDESELVQEKRLDLIHSMNQLRSEIDFSIDYEVVKTHRPMGISEEKWLMHLMAVSDAFERDCKKIFAPIARSESYFNEIERLINVMFKLACFVLIVYGGSFLFLVLRSIFFGPRPPNSP